MHARILSAAISLSHTLGYEGVTRTRLARRLKCSEGLISYHFGTMAALRDAVMTSAIQTEDFKLIAQGYLGKHPVALKAPVELIRRAMSGAI